MGVCRTRGAITNIERKDRELRGVTMAPQDETFFGERAFEEAKDAIGRL